MDYETVKSKLDELMPKSGDETVLDYITGALSDEHFDFGDKGIGVYDDLGEFLVEGGFVKDDAAAKALSYKIFVALKGGQETAKKAPTFQQLRGGPVVMNAMADEDSLYERKNMRHLIQTPFEDDESATVASAKDRAKLEKRRLKEEAAMQNWVKQQTAHADQATRSRVVILRDQGKLGLRDIHLEDVTVTNGGQELIEGGTLTLANGRRYGLVGRNGTGKSTLLRALAQHGIKGLPSNCQVLHVEQEIHGTDISVLDAVLQCDEERTNLLEEEKQLLQGGADQAAATDGPKGKGKAANGASQPADSERLGAVYKRLQDIDADGAPAKAAAILAGLSFDPPMQKRATRTFSGGWRMRVALAQALFVEPDLLLLDEPTNHLDLHAVLWLEEYLVSWPGTVIVVSHAREFLNSVCTDIVHLHSRKLTVYKGTFSDFEKQMRERLRNQAKQVEAHERSKKHMQAFIDKFRYNAKRASLVQSRIKAMERLGDVESMEQDPDYQFNFPTPDTNISPPIISFTDVAFAYPGGQELFHSLSFGIGLDSRLAIVGRNGAGKTTLLNLISGILKPTRGHVTINPKIRLATFSQHHVDGLAMHQTPLQYFAVTFPEAKEPAHRSHLASFGISGTLVTQPMYTLSGGQKSRVAFAKVTWQQPHILLLDEPSNHLDMDAIDALVIGLNTFQGGVLMVSHDQYLIEATVDELWMCQDSTITPFHGDFALYKKMLKSKS